MKSIQKLRESRNLSQKDLAARSGVALRTIQRHESAGTWPRSRLAADAILRTLQ